MAKAQEITIGVNCKLAVDENTAHGALWLVQTYLNSNNRIKLVQRQTETGETELAYEPFN